MSETLHLTCQCGAVLDVVAETRYSLTITHERRAFDQAHQVCRERERPLVMWGGDQA